MILPRFLIACRLVLLAGAVLFLAGPSVRAADQAALPEAEVAKEEEELINPFLPPEMTAQLRVTYELTGRLDGRAELVVDGSRRILRLKAIDRAYGLNRPVEFIRLTEPEWVTTYDLVAGTARREVNVGGVLAGMWSDLDRDRREQVNRALWTTGQALSPQIKAGQLTKRTVEINGLDGVSVRTGDRTVVFWQGSDVILEENVTAGGHTWKRQAMDVIVKPNLNGDEFDLPPGLPEPEQTGHWLPVWIAAAGVIDLLATPPVPVLVTEKESQAALEAAGPPEEKKKSDGGGESGMVAEKPAEAGTETAADSETQTETATADKTATEKKAQGDQAAGTELSYEALSAKRKALRDLPIPWPAVSPPDFRTVVARYQAAPDWLPYPAPPGDRPWPPMHLGEQLVKRRAKAVAEMIVALKPLKEPIESETDMAISDSSSEVGEAKIAPHQKTE